MPYPDAGPRCPIAGCPRRRETDHLMCGRHWHRVPRALQDRVYRTWNARLRTDDPAAVNAHEAAKKAAIEAVEAQDA